MWNGQVHGADGRDSIAGWQKTTAGVRGAAEGAGLVSGVMGYTFALPEAMGSREMRAMRFVIMRACGAS